MAGTDVQGMLVRIEATTQQLRQELARAETAVGKTSQQIDAQLGKVDGAFARLGGSSGALGSAMRALAPAMAAVVTVESLRRTQQLAEEFSGLEARVRRLSTGTDEAGDTFARLAGIASTSGASMGDTVRLWESLTGTLKEMGANNDQVLRLTSTLQKIGKIGGSSAQEMSDALRQLGQGLAGGVLRAEEFNSVLEGMPELAREIARGLGVPFSELRQLMLDGELTADKVLAAIQRRAFDVDAEFAKLPRTVTQAAAALTTEFGRAVAELDRAIGASSNIAWFFDTLAKGVRFSAGNYTDQERLNLLLAERTRVQESLGQAERRTILTAKQRADLDARLASLSAEISEIQNRRIQQLKNESGEIKATGEARNEEYEKYLGKLKDAAALQGVSSEAAKVRYAIESGALGKLTAEQERSLLQYAEEKDAKIAAADAEARLARAREQGEQAAKREADGFQRLMDQLLPAEAAQRQHEKTVAALDNAYQLNRISLEQYTAAMSAAWVIQNQAEWDKQNEQQQASIRNLDELADRVAKLGMDEFQVAALDFSKLAPAPEHLAQFDAYIAKLREFKEAQDATAALDTYLSADFGADLAAGFDAAGQSLGQFVTSFGKLIDIQELYNKAVKANSKDMKALAKIEAKNARDQINAYGNMAGAAKGFFKEGSSGYKTLQAAEMAFRAVEMALAVEALAVKLGLMEAEMLGALAKNAAITASSAIAAAVSSMVGLPFPLNLAALAATTAAIVAIAGSIFGGGGGGSSGPSAAQIQASNNGKGFGTTLGDPKQGSESIVQSLELLSDRQDKLLRVNNNMLSVLQSIDNGIHGYAAQIFQFRELTGAKVGGFSVPDVSFAALETLLPQLINANPNGTRQTQDATRIVGRTTGKLEADIQAAEAFYGFFTASVSRIGDVFRTGAPLLGRTAEQIETALAAASVGELNIKGLKKLKGDELAERLGNIVGAAGDRVAAQLDESLGLGLRRFQQVGEGMSATMVRVSGAIELAESAAQRLRVSAVDYTEVLAAQGDVAAEIIRQSVLLRDATSGIPGGFAEMVGAFQGSAEEIVDFVLDLRSLQDALTAAGQRASYLTTSMIQGAGGLDLLTDGLQAYFEDFLTPAEQAADLMRRLGSEFGALGMVVPSSIDDFRRLVEGIDTTTEAGQRLYGSLIALSPAFSRAMASLNAAVGAALDAQNAAVEAALRTAESAAQEVSRAQSDLQRAVEASNKPITDSLRASVTAFTNAATALRAFSSQLDGLGQAPAQTLARLRAEFDALSRRARLGDAEAGVQMATVGKALADAVLRNAATAPDAARELARIQREADAAAEVADRQKSLAEQQLDQLAGIGESSLTIAEATQRLADAQAAQAAAQARYSALLAAALSEEQIRRSLVLQSIVDALDKSAEQLASVLTGSFSQLDGNLDGLLTFDELRTALAGKATDDEIRNMIAALDANTDGMISAAEAGNARLGEILRQIVAGVDSADWAATAAALKSGFSSLDGNLDGLLTFDELRSALGPLAKDSNIARLITELDVNGDGMISAVELASRKEVQAVNAVEAAIRAQAAQIGAGVTENVADAGKEITQQEFKNAVLSAAGSRGISAALITDQFVASLFRSLDSNSNNKIKQGGTKNEYSQLAVENAVAGLLSQQGGGGTTTTPPTTTKPPVTQQPTAFNASSYLSKNPDVAAAWNAMSSAARVPFSGDSLVYALWHYGKYGHAEGRQFWAGGYTGPGGKFDEAGVVHKGEVVFSQMDVARFGGWQNVEALRRGALDIESPQLQLSSPQLSVATPHRPNGDAASSALLAEIGQLRVTVEQQGYALVSMADNLADIKKSNRHLRDWARTGVPLQESVA